MSDEPHNLILEHLRELRDGQFNGIRHMLVAMQSDALRQEAILAALRSDADTTSAVSPS